MLRSVIAIIIINFVIMFTRAFMRRFDHVKYRNPIEPYGQLTATRIKFWSDIEVANMRLIAYLATAFITYNIWKDPGVLAETFFHPHYPVHQPYVYNKGIPQYIKDVNEVPMAQLQKLKETQKLLDTFNPNLFEKVVQPGEAKE